MGVPNILTMLPLIAILVIVTSTQTYAQDSSQDYLNAHNRARSNVGVSALRWDANLANYAQNYLNGFKGSCNMVHSGGPYGENLAWGYPDLTGTAAVTTPTLVLVASACTTLKWCGATQLVLGVPRSSATMVVAHSSAATMIPGGTILVRGLMILVLSQCH
uniref:SCP domain-containing protein n=1 Tax=Lotus japonicus TaxID=34305 RepID=I3SF28_LOTJA|nr:unknown [Lotus japonicus]